MHYTARKTRILPWQLSSVMTLLFCSWPLLAADPPPASEPAATTAAEPVMAKAEKKDLVLRGDAVCTRCHDESDEPRILTIGKTRHGVTGDARTPTCTSCHGESDKHVNKPADVAERPKPDRMFGKLSKTPMVERDGACLTCHQGGKRIHWAMGAHASNEVGCASCHQVHNNGQDKVRNKATQVEICTSCHKVQRSEINKPSHHPIIEGKVACSDCHNPHGTAGEKLLVRDNVNDTCYTCHAEKRGPFLRGHQPVTERCTICHNPHGSINTTLLRLRPPFLCQQCHEPTGHRGTIPQIGPAFSNQRFTMARGCVNCHTLIHGTNNPNGSTSGERKFRK